VRQTRAKHPFGAVPLAKLILDRTATGA